jgi:hypothetical protein
MRSAQQGGGAILLVRVRIFCSNVIILIQRDMETPGDRSKNGTNTEIETEMEQAQRCKKEQDDRMMLIGCDCRSIQSALNLKIGTL